eukprot:9503294-Pyramimonas_sp.AAC.1
MNNRFGEAWERERDALQRRESAGGTLCEYLLSMYAESRPMTAKDVCILAWHAKHAGAIGTVCNLAMDPKNKGGSFQQHLDTCIPKRPPDGYYWVETPVFSKGVGRTTRRIPTVPLHEAIEEQVVASPELARDQLDTNPEFLEWHSLGFASCRP